MSDFDQYLQNFPVGMKVRVGIPVPGNEAFHDWAVILDIEEDLLSLQLSRDVLPFGVRLTIGSILDIRAGNENSGYSCRAIIVSEGRQRELLLRLIGEIVSDELREFYRIDAFLPIKYFVSEEQSEVKLRGLWRAKREARIESEKERKQQEKKKWEQLRQLTGETFPSEEASSKSLSENSEKQTEQSETAEEELADHSWDDVMPLAANISGGGMRMLLHHKFAEGTFVPLEIYLPAEPDPIVIDAVGIVAFASENHAAGKQFNRPSYNTGLKFKFIEERDRDNIVSYISNVQLKRIRMMREQYLFRSGEDGGEAGFDGQPAENRTMLFLKTGFIIFAALISLVFIVGYFWQYAENRPKNEIEVIFEKGFVEYLKKVGRQP